MCLNLNAYQLKSYQGTLIDKNLMVTTNPVSKKYTKNKEKGMQTKHERKLVYIKK